MTLVDANVLLYAVNTDADRHAASRRWLDGALSGRDTVAFAWIALLTFVRLVTKPEILPRPLTVDQAMDRVDAWLSAAPAVVVEPTVDHPAILRRLPVDPGAGGNLVNDAHLAGLAIEHRCVIVSWDRDFGRFGDVRWQTPQEPTDPTR